ncbi:hypothetical protein M9H77_11944 [Catharanthus roseus]|uniref:Uncharacterized protein n=1 Tax=Catharanthus roseus TaxID=4058 RepID=A0ACC0BG30_CATRO|nr:hypothetical protein M9H77_11944 [Catharanthus roseus]
MVFRYLSSLEIMPPCNSAAFNKKSRAAASPSNNEPILPLPYRLLDEANRITIGWDSLVTMIEDYYLNLVREFYANIFLKLTSPLLLKGVQAQAVGKRVVKSNSLERTWKVASLLIGTNIAPRSPNQTTDLRMIDIYIMDKMRTCSPMPERVNYEKPLLLRT